MRFTAIVVSVYTYVYVYDDYWNKRLFFMSFNLLFLIFSSFRCFYIETEMDILFLIQFGTTYSSW